jgi:hypothetical protein
MAIIVTMCSQTGKQVSTGIEMDAASFNALPYTRYFAFDCWLCGNEHRLSRRWATLVDEPDRGVAAQALPHSGTEIRATVRDSVGFHISR